MPSEAEAALHSSDPGPISWPAGLNPSISEAIRDYQILSLSQEQGAEGDVYFARGADNKLYAIKVHRRPACGSVTTAQALAELHGDRLLVPIEHREWEGRALDITPYFPEGSLAELIKRGPLSDAQVIRLVSQVTEGLEQLHRCGIQHRDLKSTNILVRRRDPLDVVLADFGSAAIAEATVMTQVHGTLFYSAPETLTGMYSRASDYWSLGIILIEALTGASIGSMLKNDASLPYKIVQGKVPIPETIPKGWFPLLKGLLERNHYRRWQSAEVRLWINQKSAGLAERPEKKARPMLIAGLFLALVLAGGAGLRLAQLSRPDSHLSSVTQSENSGRPATELPSTEAKRGVAQAGEPITNGLPALRTAIMVLTWILAGGCALIGIAHIIGGAHHGWATIFLGFLLGVLAYYLPEWWFLG